MGNIPVVEDAQASGETAKVSDEWRAKSGRKMVPGILKCFSARPDFLRQVIAMSDTVHFSEGHLTRRTKEMLPGVGFGGVGVLMVSPAVV